MRQPAGRLRGRPAPRVGLALAAAALGIAAFGGALDMSGWGDPSMAPTLFPALALGLLALMGLAIAAGLDRAPPDEAAPPRILPVLLAGGGIAAYVAILPAVGWVPASAALLVGLPLATGYRDWRATALFAGMTLGLVWLVFDLALNIPLNPFP